MRSQQPALRATAVAASIALLSSCAGLMPFTPDRTAKAPRLSGFGQSDTAVTTDSEAARQLFRDGMLQAFAFNEHEAVRMFKAALAQDPQCALCAWGVAWQLGPIINDPSRGRVPEALKYVDYAVARLDKVTPRERALVESLALRYAHVSQQRETAPLTMPVCGGRDADKADPLDVAYAERLRKLVDASPNDADLLALYAEAEMIATEGDDLWSKDGKPAGRVGEVAQRLEKALATHPQHTGLNHYMVHIVDAQPVAQRAEAAADRLSKLAPLSPHLVHMPSHTYVHIGRWNDAMRVNQQAVAADVTLADAQKAQGFDVSKDWRGHNSHFLWYAAVTSAQEEPALAGAATLAEQVDKDDSTFAEIMRSLRVLTLVRMERWDRVLAEPQARGNKGVAEMFHAHARGVAQARLGKMADAQASLAQVKAVAQKLRTEFSGTTGRHKNLRAIADYAEHGLLAEIDAAQRGFDTAIEHQRKVVQALEKLDAREPPMFGDGSRLALGALQAKAARWADAEASYRQVLAEHPGNGWALRGLAQALQAQGKRPEADDARRQLEKAWPAPPTHLKV